LAVHFKTVIARPCPGKLEESSRAPRACRPGRRKQRLTGSSPSLRRVLDFPHTGD